MPEFLENPRRAPRTQLRCLVQLSLPWGPSDTSTEDIGARGCQVIVDRAPERGAEMSLVLSAPGQATALRVNGRVAWVSPRAPWRVGIAFLPESLAFAARWVEQLRRATPALFPAPRAPDRVAVDATVYLGPVPRLADFVADEVQLLRAVGAGIRVGDLRSRFELGWQRGQRAFFALLSQGHLTLSRASATHPLSWKGILGEPSREELAKPSQEPPAKAPPPAAARPDPTPAPTRAAPKVPARTPPPAAPPPPRDRANDARAGGGWRAPAGPRSPTADEMYRLGKAEISAGRTHQALALLRAALSIAPGDPEIAIAIGVAMQTGRSAP
jgi:hypothetical protein